MTIIRTQLILCGPSIPRAPCFGLSERHQTELDCRLSSISPQENFTMAHFLCVLRKCERVSEVDLFCYALLDFGVHNNAQKDKIQMIIIILWTETTTVFMGFVLFSFCCCFCFCCLSASALHPSSHFIVHCCVYPSLYIALTWFFRRYVNLFRCYYFIYIWFGVCSAW